MKKANRLTMAAAAALLAALRDTDGYAVRMPFDSIGFAPHVDPRVRFLPMVTVEDYGETGRQFLSWQGGVPHTPVTWGELSVNIE